MRFIKIWKRFNKKYEVCVLCRKQLDIPISAPIERREHYIHGCGQLCAQCYLEIVKQEDLSADQLKSLIFSKKQV